MDKPSLLDVQACLWSDYNHNFKINVLVFITPKGKVSWASPVSGVKCLEIQNSLIF